MTLSRVWLVFPSYGPFLFQPHFSLLTMEGLALVSFNVNSLNMKRRVVFEQLREVKADSSCIQESHRWTDAIFAYPPVRSGRHGQHHCVSGGGFQLYSGFVLFIPPMRGWHPPRVTSAESWSGTINSSPVVVSPCHVKRGGRTVFPQSMTSVNQVKGGCTLIQSLRKLITSNVLS